MNKTELMFCSSRLALVLVLPLAGPDGLYAVYLLCLAFAFLGPRQSIEALVLSWLASSLNPGIYPVSDSSMTLLRMMIVFAALFVGTKKLRIVGWDKSFRYLMYGVFVFLCAVALSSIVVSYDVTVSLFKIISFSIGVSAVVLCINASRADKAFYHNYLMVLFTAVLLTSFPLIITSLGYFKNLTGFQGILNHPQLFGAFLSISSIYLLTYLWELEKINIALVALAVLSTISLLLTQSRTGVFALAIGLFAYLLLTMSKSIQARNSTVTRVLIFIFSIIGVYGSLVIAYNIDVAGAAFEFAIKGGRDGAVSVVETIEGRQFLIMRSIDNFSNNMITGIGFGLATIPGLMEVTTDPILGLPISAPIEKTNIYIGLLEETGLIGVVCFTVLILLITRPMLLCSSTKVPIATTLTVLALGVGEAFLFSINGFGLFCWIIIVYGLLIARKQKRMVPIDIII